MQLVHWKMMCSHSTVVEREMMIQRVARPFLRSLMRTSLGACAVATLLTLGACGASPTATGSTTGSGASASATAATGTTPNAPAASSGTAQSGTVRKVNANTASQAELKQALQDAGVPNADRWVREVVEYRPYPTNDPSLGKLRGELAKYNPGPGVVDKIISALSL